MKIVFYNETIMSGGIEKCIETLIEYLYKEHEIEIIYTDEKKLTPDIVNKLSQRAFIHKLDTNKKVYADICIWCRIYMDYDFLKRYIIAERNILWVHSNPKEKEGCILENKEFLKKIDKIICVSETIKKLIETNNNMEVIHNFLPNNINKLSNMPIETDIFCNSKKLKLITVSRLSNGKGFERILNLVKMLKQNNVNFEYIVIGKGRAKEFEIKEMFKEINEVIFIGYRDNPYPYIKKADYLVQLSDFESWGNVITEAKYLKIPVIITNFESAYEQVEDDFNGIIIDLNDTNYQKYLDKIIKNNEKYKKNLKSFIYKNEIEKWNEILNSKKK